MKRYLIIIPVIFLTVNCSHELPVNFSVTDYHWQLLKVETGTGEELKPEDKDYLRDDAYVLVFESDSTFRLNTSVNVARGKCIVMEEDDKIEIVTYQEITEIATADLEDMKLNNGLIKVIRQVEEYEKDGDHLVLEGMEGKAKFKKVD